MSLGGWLVVMDRAGRDVKHYRLRTGAVTLGSDPACDIRVMVPTVSPHHATVSALYHQTVVRSVSERETLVNGVPVSVAALRHGDVISLGGRALRWEYRVLGARRPLAPEPALLRRVQRARVPRRASDPPPRKVIVPEHRATMPASTSGKQVAIVQPQRRDTSDLSDATSPRLPPNKRARLSRQGNAPASPAPTAGGGGERVELDGDRATRSTNSPRTVPNLANTTKATLWIESRKTSPRKSVSKTQTPTKTPIKTPVKTAVKRNLRKAASAKKNTPLRMVVLKKAQSAQKMKVTKIQAPLKMDSTKQAAIMLMTRHTPKSKQSSANQGNKGPSFAVKRPSPVKDPRNRRSRGKGTYIVSPVNGRNTSDPQSSLNHNISDNGYPSVIEITDSETQSSTRDSSDTRRSGRSSLRSPRPTSPRKSALKDPNAKRMNRKTESIKFDLSNLDNASHDRSSDVMLVNDMENNYIVESENEFTLRYSDSSKSPSPRKSINSRSRRMLQSTLGNSITLSPKADRKTFTPESPRVKKSLRGSIILQEALRINESDGTEISTYSRRTTKSLSDNGWSTTIASTHQTRSLSPRASRNNMESYSIVDLVSIDSNDSTASRSDSVYTSADSNRSVTYDTPGSNNLATVSRRNLDCSTPYDLKSRTSAYESPASSVHSKNHRTRSAASNANSSVTTPENTEDTTKNITLNSTKISRASKKRFRNISRQNALIYMNDDLSDDDSSPKSSKRISKGSQPSPLIPKNINETFSTSPSHNEGMHTPENRHSPVEASTPVLNIQSLLDASQNSNITSKGNRRWSKRKSIATLRAGPQRGRTGMKSKSLTFRRSGRVRGTLSNVDGPNDSRVDGEEEVVTPKSAAKPFPEGVKNKHSSAKKPVSKRSLIDNLNESDIVKQLFNSPVKRKLSQSMTEFSKRHLFEDLEERPRRPTRATIAVAGRSLEHSLLDHTEQFTPEIFVSPLNTPSNSPNVAGIRRLFQKNTPENDLRNVSGVKALLRTPRTRSAKNDLSNASNIKAVFAKSPLNRLSDVRVKEIFAASPKNDLRRVSGVKDLFQSELRKDRSPRNELDDLRGVRTLFKEDNPRNDLRNVSGIKMTLLRKSPRNDLTDVRGVKRMFRLEQQRNELSDMSGIERLYHEPSNYDSTFDQLMGRQSVRSVYTKSKSFSTASKVIKKGKNRKSKSLHDLDLITNNVEEWIQKEFMETKKNPSETSNSTGRKSLSKSRNISKTVRELQKLNTNTVDGSVPVITNRTRNSSILNNVQSDLSSRKKSASELYSAHTLPIKKRSLVESVINRSSNDKSHKLPIKKRVVVHSTPVKGRVNMTMNASEIGRMSPISSEDKTGQIDNIIGSPQRQVLSKPKSPQSKSKPGVVILLTENTVAVAKLSPKKTRSAKIPPGNSAPTRSRRSGKSKGENQEMLNVKKRRSSIVIVKKTPVLSRKPSPKVKRNRKTIALDTRETPKISPKKTRTTRGQKSQAKVDVKTVTPKKNTRTKVIRTSEVVIKPSPKLKPRTTRNTKDVNEVQTKRSRKVTITEPEVQDINKQSEQTHLEVLLKKKPRKTAVESGQPVDKSLSIIQTRRTRKATVETTQIESSNKKPNAQNKKNLKVVDNKARGEPKSPVRTVEQTSLKPELRRGRKIQTVDNGEDLRKDKGRKTAAKQSVSKSVTNSQTNAEAPVIKATRGRRTKQEIPSDDNKNIVLAELPVGRGRKRKNTERDDPGKDYVEKKETRRTRKDSRKEAEIENKSSTNTGKYRNTRRGAGDESNNKILKLSNSVAAESGTKTRRGTNAVAEVKPVKGRKTTSVAESAPKASGRGRNKRTNVEIAEAKEQKEPTKKARKAAATPPATRSIKSAKDTTTAATSRMSRARRR